MKIECINNCFDCEWRKDKSVDDILFCQNTRVVMQTKGQSTMLAGMQEKIDALTEIISEITTTTSKRELSDFTEVTELTELTEL